jgi:hypothetical protein
MTKIIINSREVVHGKVSRICSIEIVVVDSLGNVL